MRKIQVEKITLNIGTGEPGDSLTKAMKLLKIITGAKPVETVTKKRIPTWKVRPGLSIGCKVTLRGEKAKKLLKQLLGAVDYMLSEDRFDKFGNFSFGIKEYINIPDVKYDPEVGIIGLEVAVTLKRPGFRVKRRRLRRANIPKKHQVTKEEAVKFMQDEFDVKSSGDEI